MAVGCRIKKNIVRPDRSLVEAFRGIPVANIDDCMNRLSAVQAELCPMNSSPPVGHRLYREVPRRRQPDVP